MVDVLSGIVATRLNALIPTKDVWTEKGIPLIWMSPTTVRARTERKKSEWETIARRKETDRLRHQTVGS